MVVSVVWGLGDMKERLRHGSASDVATHLVIDLVRRVWEVDGLLKDIVVLLELFRLGPVVECACHVDVLGGVLPVFTATSAIVWRYISRWQRNGKQR